MKNTVTWSSYPIAVIYPDKLTVELSKLIKEHLYRHAHSKEHYLKQQKQKATVIFIRRQEADEMAYWVKKGTRTKADNLSLISRIHKSMAEERTDSQSCPLPFTCMHSWVHTLMKREKKWKENVVYTQSRQLFSFKKILLHTTTWMYPEGMLYKINYVQKNQDSTMNMEYLSI